MRRVRLFTFLVALFALAPAAFAAAPAHEGDADAAAAHGGHDDHVPHFEDINWFYGMLGTREGVEPNLVYRPPEMPVPVGALLVNTAIVYFILFRIFRRPVSEGLKRRKETLLRGMDEAAKMRREAEEQLASYEQKLARIDEEVERVKQEMHAAGEAERARVLAEARERRERMERDARVLVEQELKAVREQLLRETVESAVRSAETSLAQMLTPGEHQRLAEEYVASLSRAASTLKGRV
ncbi:MAG TPA: ATP synthase F0 subunit B [Polyangiaceae bacterium]|nr:ATP synthase F0 subunit B [Polyangiaceae bacterium]